VITSSIRVLLGSGGMSTLVEVSSCSVELVDSSSASLESASRNSNMSVCLIWVLCWVGMLRVNN
jgi:hypothetical protein